MKTNNMKNSAYFFTLLAVVVSLAACGGGGGDSGEISPSLTPPETLVFIGSDGVTTNGENELYAIDDDGKNQRLLSKELAASDSNIYNFAISPDNQWVAYIADHQGFDQSALFVTRLSGGAAKQVSRVVRSITRKVRSFQWSPDSQNLVYAANLDGAIDGNSSYRANEVYLVKKDGTNERKINGSIGRPAIVEVNNPQWSPDGQYIVQEVFNFSNGIAAPHPFALNIYNTTLNTPNSTRLVNVKSSIKNVRWSPDSKRLAYRGDFIASGTYQINVIGVSGSPHYQVTSNGGFNSDSQWKPNGAELTYLDHPSVALPSDLAVSAGNGSATKRVLVFISNNNRSVKDFRWSPDGSKIAYTSDQDTERMNELYVISANGGSPTRINDPLVSNGDVFKFEWSPSGQHIAYLADQDSDMVVDLYVSNTDGSGTRKISAGIAGSEVEAFDWSRDGSRLAFNVGANDRRSVPDKLYVNTVDGNHLRQVSDTLTDKISDFSYQNYHS